MWPDIWDHNNPIKKWHQQNSFVKNDLKKGYKLIRSYLSKPWPERLIKPWYKILRDVIEKESFNKKLLKLNQIAIKKIRKKSDIK